MGGGFINSEIRNSHVLRRDGHSVRDSRPQVNSNEGRTRINGQITAPSVRLIKADGEQVGIVSLAVALAEAEAAELDLVEIAPNVSPPVCKVMNFGKFLFEKRKKTKNKAKKVQLKELRMRPVTDVGDYALRLKQARNFLLEGNKVKMSIRFRGRELAYQQQGEILLKRAEEDLKGCGVVEQFPKLERKQMTMVIVPNKNKK